ncbi:4-oxalomesaconate tautomerase [Rhodobacteraceae bacterium NNCM2]|nr:4-oxalomesaconate tautomerase [Coraliihabitans acroporae]
MTQTAIPFLFMRGGTSRGPYMNRADLPEDRETLAKVLIAAVGAGHPLNIDGIGGGAAVTTKVAMLSRSAEPGVDIDYFFAQVSVEEKLVDFKPTCGNILSGVGPAAIEMGLVAATPGETAVRIRAVNTGALIDAVVQTPGGKVAYEGAVTIDGVPGTAAPVALSFMGVVGSATGSLLPTGNVRETIDGIEVTCIDVAMPLVIARAEAFGLTGHESREELDANRAFFARMEAIRIEAGKRMGMGDVSKSVTPKFAVMAPPRGEGSFAARYFMPWQCHPTMAVTGAQCIAACALTPGAVADGLMVPPESPARIVIEHPSGEIEALIDFAVRNDGVDINAAGLTRTARLLARGELYVPASVWSR